MIRIHARGRYRVDRLRPVGSFRIERHARHAVQTFDFLLFTLPGDLLGIVPVAKLPVVGEQKAATFAVNLGIVFGPAPDQSRILAAERQLIGACIDVMRFGRMLVLERWSIRWGRKAVADVSHRPLHILADFVEHLAKDTHFIAESIDRTDKFGTRFV
jgi:hypothetical protein